jgi:hypothetical protein
VGRCSVATFMIIVKSPGNCLIVILHRTGGGQTERRGGGGLYGKRIKRRKQIKSLAFSGSSLKGPSEPIV